MSTTNETKSLRDVIVDMLVAAGVDGMDFDQMDDIFDEMHPDLRQCSIEDATDMAQLIREGIVEEIGCSWVRLSRSEWERHVAVILADAGLVFMLLTKRASNIARMVPPAWLTPDGHPSQVWYGTSVGNQQAANERIPHMVDLQRRTNNRATLFFSFEPLLGPVDVNKALGLLAEQRHTLLAGSWWLIGGESGAAEKVRAMDVAWAESLMAQAQAMGAYWHMKQCGRLWYDQKRHEGIRGACIVLVDNAWRWVDQKHKKGGDPSEWPEHLRVREIPPGYAWDMTMQDNNNDSP